MNYYDTYTYGYAGPTEDTVVTTILLIYLAAVLLVLAGSLAAYLIKGFGLYRMAQREGREYPWLAFVPFARKYLQGEISGDIVFGKRTVRNPGIWLIVIPIMGNIVLTVFGVIVWGIAMGFIIMTGISGNGFSGIFILLLFLLLLFILAAVAYSALVNVLRALIDYQIFSKFTTKNTAFVHALLSILLPLYEAICLFVYRNRDYNEGMGPEPEMTDMPSNMPEPPVMPAGNEHSFVYTERPAVLQSDTTLQPDTTQQPAETVTSAETIVPVEKAQPDEEAYPVEEVQPVQDTQAEKLAGAVTETTNAPYVYRDFVEVKSEEPESYDVSKEE